MNDISGDDLADILNHACEQAAKRGPFSLFQVSSVLKEGASEEDEDPVHALRAGLDYHFLAYEEHRDGGGPFGPQWVLGGRAYPRPVAELPHEVLALWAAAVDVSTSALVSARFADLLWEARYGEEPYRWCQVAIDKYQDAIDEGSSEIIELHDGGRRALELALQINDRTRQESAIQNLLVLIYQSIGDGGTPGVALPLLELLAAKGPDLRPAELEDLVDQATDVYGTDPWHLESALDIKAKLSRPEDREDLWRAQVGAFVDLAHRSEGLVKYAHLQRAIEMAEEHRLHEMAEELRRGVETISENDLGLKEISVEIQIPKDDIEKLIALIVGDDDLVTALARFGLYLPMGEPEESREFVDDLLAEYPLQALVTHMTIGPENALLRTVQAPDDHREAALVDHETRVLTFFGYLATEIVNRIIERFGPISAQWEWFESSIIEPAVARRIGEAIELYEQGAYDACVSVITPRLERIVRATARTIGLSTTRSPDRAGRSGGVKSLGTLLSSMVGLLPERTRRHLKVLLVETTGLNLRNRISHGLMDEVSPHEAALLIHSACHLSLLTPLDKDEEE